MSFGLVKNQQFSFHYDVFMLKLTETDWRLIFIDIIIKYSYSYSWRQQDDG